LTSSSRLRRTIRRLNTGGQNGPLRRRERSELPFIEEIDFVPKLLLDTTVYIDQLGGRMPAKVETIFLVAPLWHSTVTESELSVLTGLLDPRHPDSARVIDRVTASIEGRPAHRIINPDRDIWCEAGILSGIIARLQQYGKADQRRVLNDALIFLSAAKEGLAVLTRNIADYDLLMQIAPHGQAVFYDLDE